MNQEELKGKIATILKECETVDYIGRDEIKVVSFNAEKAILLISELIIDILALKPWEEIVSGGERVKPSG